MMFITSDTHFGDRTIWREDKCPRRLSWCNGTVEDHDRQLIAIWNRVVGIDDTVLHLGDFSYGRSAAFVKDVRKQLNGTIWLVHGNHDRTTSSLRNIFTAINPRDVVAEAIGLDPGDAPLIYCRHAPFTFTAAETEAASELWHGHVHNRAFQAPTPKHRAWGVDRQLDLISPVVPLRLHATYDV